MRSTVLFITKHALLLGLVFLHCASAAQISNQSQASITNALSAVPGLDYIDSGFENASPLWYEISSNGIVQIHLLYDHERSSPNRAAGHWHFLLHGRTGAKLSLVLNNLDNIWNGKPGSIAREQSMTMISEDGRNWKAIPIKQVPVGRLQIDLEMPGPKLYVARVEPYRVSDLQVFLDSIKGHPAVAIESIGKTVKGRNLDLIRIGNDEAPYRVFIRARSHPWEAGGNWVVEGLVKRLLRDDVWSYVYLKQYCVYILPMANRDGVEFGRTRFNFQGMDLNRKWNQPADPELAPENHALERRLAGMIAAKKAPHLALDLHNDGNGQLHLSRPPIAGVSNHLARMQLLEQLLRKHTWFTEGSTSPSFQNPGSFGEGWLTRFGIDAAVHEFNATWIAGLKDYPNRNHWLRYGEQLCTVLYEYFDTAHKPRQSDYSRLRLMIETDAGGDPDDEQSLVRFLLYANEWDVEGIIANRPIARSGENRNTERTGLGIVRRMIDAYGQCWTNLVRHDIRYPDPEKLRNRTVAGYNDTEDAVNLIIAAVDKPDPRPLWYSDWGTDNGAATNNLKRALDRVLRERGPSGYAEFKSKLRLTSYDKFGDHMAGISPSFKLWVNTFQPAIGNRRWYHRFSQITAHAGGFDLVRDVIQNHGSLGALYPTNTSHWAKEGDSMTFIYLIPTGMNQPDEPTWGSWAGRYGFNTNYPGKPYYWACESDVWNGTSDRDNTLARWAVPLQNDFRARMDWCVNPLSKANHPPQMGINGNQGRDIIHLYAYTGSTVDIRSDGTSDPDRQKLKFEWFVYPEAGTYRGTVKLTDATTPMVHVKIPDDAGGHTIHIIGSATDDGAPPLTGYRRVIIHCRNAAAAKETLEPLFSPPVKYKNNNGAYRSPLLRSNGSAALPQDWPEQRRAIERQWHALMGPWPAVLEQPKVEYLSKSNRENFTQHRVKLQIGSEQFCESWLLMPDGEGPFPAVLVVYYEPETSAGLNPKQSLRDFALQLTRRGFVTLSIGTPGGNAWKPEVGKAQCQPLSYHAYVAANCWNALANLPMVVSNKIGIVGHSYGGKWALFGGALWQKFACVAVSDPGIVFDETRSNVNYWEPWYLGYDPARSRPKSGLPTADNPRTGAYKAMVERGHDLHELHALIAPRPFFVSGGSEDPPERWQALNHAITVNNTLGYTNRVAMSNRPDHTPTEESNEQLYAFFEFFLK